MGSKKKQTVGFHYRWAWHFGWCRAADALLELRASDKPMWFGRLTGNTTLAINKPALFGGEETGGQGGVVGSLDVMFGDADQAPKAYATSTFGGKQSGHRGKFTTLFKGGRFGAFSANPQPVSAKVERILTDWHNDTPWYPEKAVISLPLDGAPPKSEVTLFWQQARYSTDPDAATMGMQFYDESGVLLGSKFAPMQTASTMAPVFESRSLSAMAPAGTTRIRLFMRMHRYAGVNNDGYIKGISLSARGAIAGVLNPSGASGTSHWTKEYGGLGVYGSGANTYFYGGDFLDSSYYQNVDVEFTTRAMNPAHIIYESLTNPEMQGEPIGLINDASFRAAADRLHEEGFGLCCQYDSTQQTPAEFRQRILDIINGFCSQSRLDGQYYLDLVRSPDDLDALPVIGSDDIVEFKQTPNVLAQAINMMQGEWTDAHAKTTRTTQPVYSASALRAAGRPRQSTASYPEIARETLALRVVHRDLSAHTRPSSSFELVCLRRWRGLRPGQNVRLQVPEEGVEDMVCTAVKIEHGTLTDGKLIITAVQNVFALPATVNTAESPGDWEAPDTEAVASAYQRAVETPYIGLYAEYSDAELAAIPADAGYLMTMAARAGTGISYVLATAATGEDYARSPTINGWCPSALVVEAADQVVTAFTLSGPSDLEQVVVGSWALWDDEIVRVDALDAEAASVTLGRGCADAVPALHAAGARIWFCSEAAATDARAYIGGDTVEAKLLTRTSDDEQDLESATALTVTMDDRQVRPYPPGKLRVGGTAYPATATGAFTVTWAHRNRISQADLLIDTEAASITPAPNTRYGLRFLDAADNVLVARTDIGPGTATVTLNYTGDVTLELWTINDAGESWQRHSHAFAYTPPGGSPTNTITATAYTPVFNGTIIDGGDLDA